MRSNDLDKSIQAKNKVEDRLKNTENKEQPLEIHYALLEEFEMAMHYYEKGLESRQKLIEMEALK